MEVWVIKVKVIKACKVKIDNEEDVVKDVDKVKEEDEPGGSGLAPVPLHPRQLGTRGILLHLEQGGNNLWFRNLFLLLFDFSS